MRRFFVPIKQISHPNAQILGQSAKHIQKVLRLNVGDEILLFSTENWEYKCKIISSDQSGLRCLIQEKNKIEKRSFHIALIQGLPKLNKIDEIVEKATELLVDEIFPVVCERSPQRDLKNIQKKHTRWQTLSIMACEQSERSDVPVIHSVLNWPDMLKHLNKYDMVLLCHPRLNGGQKVEELFQLINKPQKIAILIGPEGDFTPNEIKDIEERKGLLISLGSMILRSETAATVALGIIQYELQRQSI